MPTEVNQTQYQNLLDDCTFESGRPVISPLTAIGKTQVKRVALKAGTRLNCHKTDDHVLVLWLRGKARFFANDEEYAMHPGSMLEMPSGTPHGADAETDCVFTVLKFKTS
jgi:quercetin dioxygenase-like cupin family protein